MENEKAIEIFNRQIDCYKTDQEECIMIASCSHCKHNVTPEELTEAMQMAISALKKQEQERWRRYPAEKPKGGEIVLATMPAYTDRNGEEQLFGGVICAYHIDNYRGGRWGRSDGVTYGALGLCDVDPVAWRPIPKPYTEEEL